MVKLSISKTINSLYIYLYICSSFGWLFIRCNGDAFPRLRLVTPRSARGQTQHVAQSIMRQRTSGQSALRRLDPASVCLVWRRRAHTRRGTRGAPPSTTQHTCRLLPASGRKGEERRGAGATGLHGDRSLSRFTTRQDTRKSFTSLSHVSISFSSPFQMVRAHPPAAPNHPPTEIFYVSSVCRVRLQLCCLFLPWRKAPAPSR